jgi:HEPN domain-containing protein
MVSKKSPKTYSESDGINAVDMLHCAIDHLCASECLFESSPSHYDSAGYIAHLGIEMILKSILMHRDGSFPGIHSIQRLYDELRNKNYVTELPSELQLVMTTLDEYETLRYPNLNNPVEIGTEDLLHLKRLANFLNSQLPVSLVSALEQPNQQDSNSQIVKSGRVLMRKKV